MEKELGKEYAKGIERKRFLEDNCDGVEELSYTKKLPEEEVADLKEQLVVNNIELQDKEFEKEEVMKGFKEEIKALKGTQKELTDKLRSKSEFVKEKVYRITDRDTRETGYYNDEGDLVFQRPARPEEMQGTVFQIIRTGTDDIESDNF